MGPHRRFAVLSVILLLITVVGAVSCDGPPAPTPTPEPTEPPPSPTATSSPATATATSEMTPTPTATAEPTPTEAPEETPTEPSTDLDGQALLEGRCAECHTLDRVTSSEKNREEWVQTVDRMIDRGAELNASEREILIDYLVENYGE